tara:strand:- start:75 stop:431 length:357 start_codon:yes stop_codon:yes gene_type:complete
MKTTYQSGVKIIEDISGEVCHVSYREITCTWFFDPGHAWLQVNIQTLQDFGLSPQDFSEFSYTDGHDLYLEEDCDAGIFIRAVGDKAELTFKERECSGKFNVRAMQRNRNGYAAGMEG